MNSKYFLGFILPGYKFRIFLRIFRSLCKFFMDLKLYQVCIDFFNRNDETWNPLLIGQGEILDDFES